MIFEPDDLDPVTFNEAVADGLMPNVQHFLIARGTTFNHYVVSNPHGCPSREAYQTGLYFTHEQGLGKNSNTCSSYQFGTPWTLAQGLHAAGYATALVGKYADGYGYEDLNRDGVVDEKDAQYIPPGWDMWCSVPYYQAVLGGLVPPGVPDLLLAADNPNDYNYWLNHNGTLLYHGSSPSDYLTDVLNSGVQMMLENFAQRKPSKPFFLLYAIPAPHVETNYNPDPLAGYAQIYSFTLHPAPQDVGTVTDPLRQPESYNSPGTMSFEMSKPGMNSADLAGMTQQWQNRLEALKDVDRAFGNLVASLQGSGMSNTVIIFLSDNGWLYGFNCLGGKLAPYDPSIGTPLIVSVGGGVKSDALVGDNDIVPTILELAQVTPPYTPDGTSFLPLLSNPSQPWRNSYLIRYISDGLPTFGLPSWEGVRTSVTNPVAPDAMYAQYETNENEFFSVASDPQEQNNLARPNASAQQQYLQMRMHQLLTCSGQSCHAAEWQ